MADKGKGKLIAGMSGGSEDSCTHCSGVTEICRGKINPCFGGGYNVKVLSKCVEACITTLLTGKRVAGSPSSSRPRGPKPETLEIIKKVQKQIEQYWFLEPTPVDDSI